MRNNLTFSLLGLSICLLASTAAAQDADGSAEFRSDALPDVPANTPSGHFGLAGQWAISSDAGLSITNTSVSGADDSTTSLVMRPAVDYFVIENLSLGGFLGLDYTSTDGGSSTTFGIGPRVGYNIPFSNRFSVWPKAGFSFAHTSSDTDDVEVGGVTVEGESTTNTGLALNLFAPVMFHPVEHFFLGFGPALDTDLSGDNKATTFGARLALGGWFQ